MSAVYALARRIDDIGDRGGGATEELQELEVVRTQIHSLRTGAPPQDDAVLIAVDDAARRFPVPLDAFDDLVDGCEHDVAGTRYETIDELVGYCRLVAGSIGRLSVGIFGAQDVATAMTLADDLGVALQLTNILRDVAEDRSMGRVYLPSEDLAAFGCAADVSGSAHAIDALVRSETERARGWFERGLGLLPLLDRRSRACTAAMAGIYARLLARIDSHPQRVLAQRLSVPTWEKAWVAVRCVVGIGP
jgi:phytoene synthase